jgi:hypothetical protein
MAFHPQPSADESAFNMGIAILKRIDLILNNCYVASTNKDLNSWFSHLNSLLKEIKYLMTDVELDKNDEYIVELLSLDNDYRHYVNARKISNFEDYWLYFFLLEDYETFLRKCLQKRKMLMATASDPKHAFKRQ